MFTSVFLLIQIILPLYFTHVWLCADDVSLCCWLFCCSDLFFGCVSEKRKYNTLVWNKNKCHKVPKQIVSCKVSSSSILVGQLNLLNVGRFGGGCLSDQCWTFKAALNWAWVSYVVTQCIGEVVTALLISTQPPLIIRVPCWVTREAGPAGQSSRAGRPGWLGKQGRDLEQHAD